jgi:hypothetical protein
MATVSLFTSNWQTLAAGQEREFLEGSPAGVLSGTFHMVSICCRPLLGEGVTLVGTSVRTDASATPRQFYTVRNPTNQVVQFRRTTVLITP